LREIREAKPFSQEELAKASGVSVDAIGKLERGQRGAQPRTTRKLAAALGVEPAELMEEVKE
jgi:transcriptional regulator with XRE-family HTH domain